jgi:hypothetical protein
MPPYDCMTPSISRKPPGPDCDQAARLVPSKRINDLPCFAPERWSPSPVSRPAQAQNQHSCRREPTQAALDTVARDIQSLTCECRRRAAADRLIGAGSMSC